MSKLELNPDGTVTLPLRGDKKPITLPEPSVAQMAEMTSYVNEADEALPAVPALGDDPDAAEVRRVTGELRERTMKMYAADAPYAMALIRIVKLMTDEAVTLDDLPSWAASPQTVREITGHWQTPLAGEG